MIKSAAFAASSPALDRPVGPRVLLVEDDERQRLLLGRLLEDQGYAVEAVGSVASAVGALRSPFDLLVTDIDLGARVTGRELVRLARAVQPELPIIILSARDPAADVEEDVRYLRKPCTSGVILSTIKALAPLG